MMKSRDLQISFIISRKYRNSAAYSNNLPGCHDQSHARSQKEGSEEEGGQRSESNFPAFVLLKSQSDSLI